MAESGPSSLPEDVLVDQKEGKSHTIQAGSHLLLQLPSKEVRQVRIDTNPGGKTINLGKFGSFKQSCLVGQPYGLSYEILPDKTLVIMPPTLLEELEETGATNELIVDAGEYVQPLTSDEIEVLKKSGVHFSEIIKKQIETHVNYELKTEYSKDKYRKRKEAKFAKQMAILEPSLFNVASYLFEKDPGRILGLRVDTLSQIANLANLRPGGRFLVVDTTGGLLVATTLERLGGSGTVLYLSETDTPPEFPIVDLLNLKEKAETLKHLDWAAADEEHVPIRAPIEPPTGEYKSEGQRERYEKRRQALEAQAQLREDLFAGEWDGLLIAAQYEPFSIVQRLTPYLAGSATVTIYSQYLQVLAEVQAKMRLLPAYLSPSITEAWLRQYQVFPGRTHPLMNMSGGGGYILHAIHVYDDPKASSVLAGRRRRLTERRSANRVAETNAQGLESDTSIENGGLDVEMTSAETE
ncbi:tRNA (adenine(58)-N(1))-methyltransferase non-catalytic subunit trm6 [Serendipita sp. 397]|nr:tRNA (adenine(58)-N(1))-methyltransferase non-catalytic subunit trm6 [Serendipita sp. 397]